MAQVGVELDGEMVSHAVVPSADYLSGVRVAELQVREGEPHRLRVQLTRPDGTPLAERSLALPRIDNDRAVTVLISRRCEDVFCGEGSSGPETCVRGSCAPEGCLEGDEPACPTVECERDEQCDSPVPCTTGECLSGTCFPRRAWLADLERRAHYALGPNEGAQDLDRFETLVTLDTQSLVDRGELMSDCRDLRVTTGMACTEEAAFWVVPGTCGTAETRVWVRAPALAVGQSTRLSVYWGDSSLEAASDGGATFRFFEDFDGDALDRAVWEATGSGTSMVVDGTFRSQGAQALSTVEPHMQAGLTVLMARASVTSALNDDFELGAANWLSGAIWNGDRTWEGVSVQSYDENFGHFANPAVSGGSCHVTQDAAWRGSYTNTDPGEGFFDMELRYATGMPSRIDFWSSRTGVP